MAFAKDTSVPVDRTKHEIEVLLGKHGAARYGYSTGPAVAEITFQMRGRWIRYRLGLPSMDEKRFQYTESRRFRRTPAEAAKAHGQEVKARWRALLLVIRAKLEAIELGIATFEEEFLPYTVLPSGNTVAEESLPIVARVYETGIAEPPLRPMLPSPGAVVDAELVEELRHA